MQGVHAGKYLPGLIATIAALPAHAQQASPTPVPTPVPAPTRAPIVQPTITTLPGVIPERFSIGPAQTPAPVPTAAPTPRPTPSATPVSQPRVAAPRATAPSAAERPAPRATEAAPAPVASPTPQAAPAPIPTLLPPVAEASPQPAQVPAQGSETPPWFWALIGAGATAAAGLAGWLLLRRRRSEGEEFEEVAATEPVAAAPAEPMVPVRGPSPARVVPVPEPAPVSDDPFEIIVEPKRIQVGERDILIELEILIGNRGTSSADAIRLSVGAISASPQQDAHIAGFNAASQFAPSAPPFDLAAGVGGRMPIQVSLARDAVHVVEVGGRPMFVPIVAIDVRWRAGLSIRRFSTSFMLGAAGQGGKLGPIWLDRGQPRMALAASRYIARAAAAA